MNAHKPNSFRQHIHYCSPCCLRLVFLKGLSFAVLGKPLLPCMAFVVSIQFCAKDLEPWSRVRPEPETQTESEHRHSGQAHVRCRSWTLKMNSRSTYASHSPDQCHWELQYSSCASVLALFLLTIGRIVAATYGGWESPAKVPRTIAVSLPYIPQQS